MLDLLKAMTEEMQYFLREHGDSMFTDDYQRKEILITKALAVLRKNNVEI